ncbi:hypothetical protein RRG08_024498 [Elysia crispata]|uniref:Uncharacterized protein n=1 Tax=Elysia crispata TaxID=231223 RepID=A0AAE1D2C0_9GAST|nr:hypothetical protein RRG08_024498 [Elysia crispata]
MEGFACLSCLTRYSIVGELWRGLRVYRASQDTALWENYGGVCVSIVPHKIQHCGRTMEGFACLSCLTRYSIVGELWRGLRVYRASQDTALWENYGGVCVSIVPHKIQHCGRTMEDTALWENYGGVCVSIVPHKIQHCGRTMEGFACLSCLTRYSIAVVL